MEASDNLSSIDSAPPEIRTDGGAPFGPRLGRAVLLLAAAVGMHIWLVRAPQPIGPLSHRPEGPATLQSGLAAAPAPPARVSIAQTASSAEARPVQVKSDFISINPAPESPRPFRADLPVATSGFVRVGVEMPAAAQGDASPQERPEIGQMLLSALTPVTLRSDTSATRPVSAEKPTAPLLDKPEKAERAPAPAVVENARREPVESARREPVESAPRERVEMAPEPVAMAASTTVVDRAAELRKQEDTVRRVLVDYARAFERLDVQAAKAIRPSLDDRALQRAFEQLDGQQFRFASCGVSVSGDDASARCRGDATYRPKVGSRVMRLTAREWTFNLSRDNDRWQIVNATLQ
jgi:hypothetical protein